MNNRFYRVWTYLRHLLTAWNTTGEGIHSPYLFYIVRLLLRDRNTYYCFSQIERLRAQLLACTDPINVVDYGSSGSPEGQVIQRRVCDIAKYHLESPRMGQILFRLVLFLSEEAKRPIQIVELGTSLGITTSYLALADSRNQVTTFEGSKAVAKLAQGIWQQLAAKNISCVKGNIDETLPTTFSHAQHPLDIVYIDANHTYEATLRYVEFFLPRLCEKGVLIIDDIYHSQDMTRAWKAIQSDARITTTIDLWHAGIAFVDKHYLKRHYRVRI